MISRAMLTISRISSTVTVPPPLQSPTHGAGPTGVVGVAVGISVGVGLGTGVLPPATPWQMAIGTAWSV
jgi:hypothetical protein